MWKLEDAKARFRDARRALRGVPQYVSDRGQDLAVVLSAADFARLSPATGSRSLARCSLKAPLVRERFDERPVRERPPVRDLPFLDE